MASEIKVNTIKDLGGNTIVSSNGSGTITGLPASAISSGTVATARLGSGTASSSTFLAGDSSYKTVSGTTINNNADNKIITGSGTANTLEAEANLNYNGTRLGVGASGSGADLGVGIHVRSADSGGTVSTDADELVLENSGNAGITFLSGASDSARIFFGDSGSPAIGWVRYFHNTNHMDFGTNESEQVRIDSNGFVGIGDNNPASKLEITHANNAKSVIITNSNSNCQETTLQITSARNSDADYNLLLMATSSGTEFKVLDNGNTANTNNSYGALSDERVKQNITDANSQWDDIKALKIRNFKLKSRPTKTQIGVVAQELEASNMNGLVEECKPEKENVAHHSDFGTIEDGTADNGAEEIKDEEGNIIGYEDVFTEGQKVKSVKYSVLYMKAIKALQESMERIETLEAKVTALENA